MKVAVIPARGGSKRIPRKNIKDFCGRPMIAWSIIAAQKSGLFDHIIVSTEDAEIAQVAREWRAEAPFTRPDDLADDHTGTTPVVAHAVGWMQDQGWPVEAVCCLYPASPFIHAEDIRKGLELLAPLWTDQGRLAWGTQMADVWERYAAWAEDEGFLDPGLAVDDAFRSDLFPDHGATPEASPVS